MVRIPGGDLSSSFPHQFNEVVSCQEISRNASRICSIEVVWIATNRVSIRL